MEKIISKATLARLPLYLSFLKHLKQINKDQNVSSKLIATSMKLNEVQVRKDLSCVSHGGKPKVGYKLIDLITDIESYLGYNDTNNAIIVGAGKLGKALLDYDVFLEYGLNILAAFDIDEDKLDKSNKIFHLKELANICQRLRVKMAIITVPSDCAQEICDKLVDVGIKAIWNFAPIHLDAPKDVIIQNENLAVSLALLSKHLQDTIN